MGEGGREQGRVGMGKVRYIETSGYLVKGGGGFIYM